MSDAPTVELLTFDCYGTLVDWERGAIGAFGRHVCPDWYVGQLAEVVERWEEIQFELIQGPYRSYREILEESVRKTVEVLKLPEPADPCFMARELGTFEPFPDTRDALRRLAKKAPLWLLSNIDNDILAHTLDYLNIPVERSITAQDIQSYKPARAHFDEAVRRSGLRPSQILHVAFGFKYDIGPAGEAGFQTCWINRAGDAPPQEGAADLEFPDLRSLADHLEA